MPSDLFKSSMGDIMSGKMGKEETKAIRAKTSADEQSAEESEKNKKALSTLGDTFKKVAKGGAVAAGAMAALPGTVSLVNKMLLISADRLARYNSTIAEAMALKRMADIRRDQKIAAQTAATTKELARSTSRLDDSMQPFTTAGTNITQWIGTKLADGVAALLEGVAQLPGFKDLLEAINGNAETQGDAMLEWMAKMAGAGVDEDAMQMPNAMMEEQLLQFHAMRGGPMPRHIANVARARRGGRR